MPAANDAVWISVLPDMSKFGNQLATGASKSADKAGQSVGSKMSGAIGTTLKRGAAVAAAGGVAAIGTALYKGFSRLQGIDQAESKLRGLGHTATGVDKIMTNALASVKGTAFGLDAAATTAAGSVAAGVKPGKELERTLKLVADTATIAGTGMDEMGAIFNKVAAGDMIQGDVLAQLGDRGIPVLKMLGDEMGYTAEQVREAAKKGYIDFATFQKAMENGLGGAAQESGKTFAGAMANTQAALGRLGAVVLGPIFERIPAVLDKAMVSLDGLGPVAERIGEFLGDAFSKFGDVLRDRILPPLQTFGGFLRDTVWPALKDVGAWLADNTATLKVLAAVVATATAAYVIYSTTVRVVSAVTAAWAAIQKVLNTSLKLNPIGMVVTALVLLGAALVVAYKKSDTFRDIVDKAWAKIKSAVSSAWEGYIKPALTALWRFIQDRLIPAVKHLWENVIKPTFQAIGAAIKFAWQNVIQPVLKLWWDYISNVLIPIVKWLWEKIIKPVFQAIGGHIKSVWQNVVKPVFQALGDFIQDKVAPAFKRGVETIKSAWEKIRDAARAPVNFVIGTVYNDGIRKVFNTVAGALGMDSRLPYAPLLGGGGSKSSPKPTPGPRLAGIGGAGGPLGFGGPTDWAKNVVGKAGSWVGKRMGGMVDGLLSRAGNSPFAQLAKGAVRKVAGMATDFLSSKADAAKAALGAGAGAALGKVGAAGRVLPAGSYRMSMPYLGYPGHYGADYAASTGTPVFSPWPGRVISSAFVTRADGSPSYGNLVKVQHDNGLQTYYAHLSARRGLGPVAAGAQIGAVGSTGNSTGPHLHFEARRGGSPFNPASLGLFDKGGWLMPGMGGVNLSRDPEPVFTGQQWDILKGAIGGPGKSGDDKKKTRPPGGKLSGWLDLATAGAAGALQDALNQMALSVDMSTEDLTTQFLAIREAFEASGKSMPKVLQNLEHRALMAVSAYAHHKEQLDKATQHVDELRGKYDAAFSGVMGNAALGMDLFGGGSLASFDRAMTGGVGGSAAFLGGMQQLIGMGLDGALLQEIGSKGSLKLVQQLIGAGPEAIARYEEMYAQATSSAEDTARLVADHQYATQLAQAEQIAARQESLMMEQTVWLADIAAGVREQAPAFAGAIDRTASNAARGNRARGKGRKGSRGGALV